MPDLLTNLLFPITVSVLGGIVVSLIEYFVIQPAKERANVQRGYLSQTRQFKIAWRTIIGGLIGAIIFPIVAAIFPNWRKIILDAFSFITSDPIEGGLLIAILGVIFGCLLGTVYKHVTGALVYALFIGVVLGAPVGLVGGIILSIFQVGKWDNMGAIVSEGLRWGFLGGAFLGAIGGAIVGGVVSSADDRNNQSSVPVEEIEQVTYLPSSSTQCPQCGHSMSVQQATKGQNTGKLFFVCQNCRQLYPVE